MKRTGIKYLESGIHEVESGIQRLSFLSWIPSMGRHDWMRARNNEKAIGSNEALQTSAFQSSINSQYTSSTKLPNPIFYLFSSRFVKTADMETPVYIIFPRQNKNNAI